MSENSSAPPSEASSERGLTPLRVGLLVGLVAIVALGLLRWLSRPPASPLPVLFELPAFTLVDQNGAPFGREQMREKIWVMDFIFTRCPGICPLLTQKLKRLSGELARSSDTAARVRFLSVSVDPEWDTPERLHAYAVAHGVDQTRWTFLTGPLAEVERVVSEGFHMAMGHSGELPSPLPEGYDIPHGAHFVLVDARGRLRGFFAEDAEGQGRLRKALKQLLEEQS